MSEEPTRLVSDPLRRAFQTELERGRVALTPANLLAAVEGLEEGKWRKLGGFLSVPDEKLDEIESQHPHLSDRLREVFSYFLRLDPDASWRSVLRALDGVWGTKLADCFRQLAEPVTDPTLTVEAVAAALQTVRNWEGVTDLLGVPGSIEHSIADSHSAAEEQIKALAEYFISTLPAPSWSTLARVLYYKELEGALQAVSSHLQREDEPTLTLPNLLSVLEGVTDWYRLGYCLGVPGSKRDDACRRSPTDSEGLEAVLKEWLENHPAPSWRGLARALYRRREVPEHTALQRVCHKYLPANHFSQEEEEKGHEHEFEHDNRKLDFANLCDLTIENQIGEGASGIVFRGTVKGFRGEIAIKQVTASESSAKELDHLCGLKHPNIIKLYGTASRDIHLYIVTELAVGSLHGHIKANRGQPDIELSVHWATGVARGMSYLHENNVVHRDLKSANVLLTNKNTAKLCDFGVSRKMDHTTQATMAGTIPWMAPEVIDEAAYSKRCDLFSYGTVLWELVTHEVPFEELKGVTFRIQKAIVNGKMPAIPKSVAGYLSTLIQSCWNMDPKKRPSFVEVLSVLTAKGSQEAGPGEGAG